MNTTIAVGTSRRAAQLTAKASHASTRTKPISPQIPKDRPDHAHQIYIFSHFQTNQVVYSLTKSMKNNKALHQLPYNGKKTVPRALRKDLWTPMATITFPATPTTSAQGLLAFRKLREYRRLHETQWDTELREKAKNKAEFNVPYTAKEINAMNKQEKKKVVKMRKKALGTLLCDQKANSIADMAAVFARLDFNPKDKEDIVEKEVKSGTATAGGEVTSDSLKSRPVEAKTGAKTPETEVVVEAEDSIEATRVAADEAPIVVQWKDILDAEYAAEWPLGVVHNFLDPLDAPKTLLLEEVVTE